MEIFPQNFKFSSNFVVFMWIWVNSRSWWWTGRPGVLRFMGSQRVGHDWVTELNLTELWEKLVTETNIQCLSKAIICLPINSLTTDPHILHFHFIMVKWWEPVKVDYKCPLYYLSFRFSMDLLAFAGIWLDSDFLLSVGGVVLSRSLLFCLILKTI